jgi:5-oxoprolinase (ATP-hydrolysing)
LIGKGFGDLQQIGNQSRPKIFDLQIKKPDLLYEIAVEIDERVTLLKDRERQQIGQEQIVMVISLYF